MHLSGAIDNTSLFNRFLINGDRGVELFFVLSGFILCLPFAHYYINGGKKVMLKRYYLRRVTRLEPPYFIAMTTLLVIQLFMHLRPVQVLLPHWLASVFYTHNFIYHHVPLLTVVAWSLEIEIQFYLIAPLLFRLLALPPLPRRVILVAAQVLLIYMQNAYPPHWLSIYSFIQYFLTGILLADLYVSGTATRLFSNNLMAIPALLCFTGIMFLPINHNSMSFAALFWFRLVYPFTIGAFFYIILKNGPIKRLFSFRFVPVIGGMCYSIYLLHYTVISFIGRYTIQLQFPGSYVLNLFFQVILLVIPILIVSSVYYYYIERPFMSGKWLDMLLGKDKKSAGANKVS